MNEAPDLRAGLKIPPHRRVRARGLQGVAENSGTCRPGAFTGRFFEPALNGESVPPARRSFLKPFSLTPAQSVGDGLASGAFVIGGSVFTWSVDARIQSNAAAVGSAGRGGGAVLERRARVAGSR